MQQGGWLLAKILDEVAKKVKQDIATAYLDKVASDLVFACGAKPAFLGYEGFPAALCTSINEEIVHGAPSERKLKEGDIIGLDLGILYPVGNKCHQCPMREGCNSENKPGSENSAVAEQQKNNEAEFLLPVPGKPFFVDAALTVAVGKISGQAAKLIETAKKALDIAIEKIRPGVHLGDISFAIQRYVEAEGFSVIRDLVGHGIGEKLHEDPEVPNFGQTGQGPVLKEGMTLAIEPMIAAGDWKVRQGKDGFAFETSDKSLAAHFEHTVAVTKEGCQVLTKI